VDQQALAIACVLKTGRWEIKQHNRVSEYGPQHVQWLKRQCDKHAPGVRFVCLTDAGMIDGVETIPLLYNWPGWWSKMELFDHDFGRVLYMDLDTVIVGPLNKMLEHSHQFTACRDFGKSSGLNSSVMAWRGKRTDLFEPFAQRPQYWMDECFSKKCWGDQGFILKHLDQWDAWQDVFPGAVGSYKLTFNRERPPASARVVCFHGKPKPDSVSHDWVPRV
jgi:hypothetical protein